MKQQYKLTLLAASLVTAFAANVSHAGQIQSSSVSIAREAITTDAQTVFAPSIAYRFAGDVDARVQAQTFQVQFTLGSGAWAVAPAAGNVQISDGVTGVIQDQNPGAGAGFYTVSDIGLSTDKKTVFATIVVGQNAASLIKQPLIAINVTANTIATVTGTNVAATRGTINGLYTVAGDLVNDFNTSALCEANKQMAVTFQHFTALSNPAVVASTTNATADEHTRSGATNTATLVTFPTNIKVVVTPATGNARVNVAGANLNFAGTVTAGAAPDAWTTSATVVNLGFVRLTQNAIGYDADLSTQYLMANGGGLLAAATATVNTGRVEASSLSVVVTPGTNGFNAGSLLALNTAANCAVGTDIAGGTLAITAGTANSPATLTVATGVLAAAVGATGTNPIYICYGVNGVATPIPLTGFTAKATLVKSAAGANLNEQNNVCSGTLYSLGGGVKIDVRNWINAKDPSYTSVIRLINPNETRAVDVYGQVIHPDGTYGQWGLLTQGLNTGNSSANKLAPRAVLNLNASQVEALLTSAPAHATAANNGSATTVLDTSAGARLRITSNAGSTLRVQNYVLNKTTGQIFEASATQGVDFEGTGDRAPAGEGQYQDQDAQKGLNGG